jgi:transcription initiation factor IIE alpha subunit
MPVKKATAAKTATKTATTAKKAPARAKKAAEGNQYSCEVCGLVVTVDEACGCVDTCDIVCCGEPMQETKVKVKAAKK